MKQEKMKLIWGIFMVIIYLGMASLLVFSEIFDIKPVFRVVIGVLMFIYGLFRGYRVWKMNS